MPLISTIFDLKTFLQLNTIFVNLIYGFEVRSELYTCFCGHRNFNGFLNKRNKMKFIERFQMHQPQVTSRNFMDSLLAFWPGLQVLKGDIQGAIELHEMLYQVVLQNNFLPEAFSHDFQVHWAQHPLRPEFLESTERRN